MAHVQVFLILVITQIVFAETTCDLCKNKNVLLNCTGDESLSDRSVVFILLNCTCDASSCEYHDDESMFSINITNYENSLASVFLQMSSDCKTCDTCFTDLRILTVNGSEGFTCNFTTNARIDYIAPSNPSFITALKCIFYHLISTIVDSPKSCETSPQKNSATTSVKHSGTTSHTTSMRSSGTTSHVTSVISSVRTSGTTSVRTSGTTSVRTSGTTSVRTSGTTPQATFTTTIIYALENSTISIGLTVGLVVLSILVAVGVLTVGVLLWRRCHHSKSPSSEQKRGTTHSFDNEERGSNISPSHQVKNNYDQIVMDDIQNTPYTPLSLKINEPDASVCHNRLSDEYTDIRNILPNCSQGSNEAKNNINSQMKTTADTTTFQQCYGEPSTYFELEKHEEIDETESFSMSPDQYSKLREVSRDIHGVYNQISLIDKSVLHGHENTSGAIVPETISKLSNYSLAQIPETNSDNSVSADSFSTNEEISMKII